MLERNPLVACPSPGALGKVCKRLGKRGYKLKESRLEGRGYYLDTFDWRLFRRGLALEAWGAPGDFWLLLRELHSGSVLHQWHTESLPGDAESVGKAEVRKSMLEWIKRRELAVKATLFGTRRQLRFSRPGKGRVATLELRSERLMPPHSTIRIKQTDCALYLAEKENKSEKRLRRQLEKVMEAQPLAQDPLGEALQHLGKKPRRYDNRPLFDIAGDEPALDVLRRILEVYLQLVQGNLEGACGGRDPEFLRDFMIASRRIQCLLNREPVFDNPRIKLIREDLAWVDAMAAPVRNLDIYLELFDEFAAAVDGQDQTLLRPLLAFHQEARRKGLQTLCIGLRSPRFKRTLEGLAEILHERNGKGLSSLAKSPIRQVAGQAISALLDEIHLHGENITVESHPEEVSALFGSAKRLGYQLELFGRLFEADRISPLHKGHRALMKALLQFRVAHLQHEALHDFKRRIRRDQRVIPVSFENIHRLIADRAMERERARRKCVKRFVDFDKRVAAGHYHKMFEA
jgi:hypothetical protein